jgi:hypothetical protein
MGKTMIEEIQGVVTQFVVGGIFEEARTNARTGKRYV